MSGNGPGRVSAEAAARALRSPFLGLQPFGDSETDGALFAGREEEIDLVAANLRAARLTTFYGPSGVGKSSLLRAGVTRRIRTEAAAAREAGRPAPTLIVHDEWAGDPAGALARRIAEQAGDETPDLPLDVAIERCGAERPGVLLLIFDQFEEYLRLHPVPEAHDDAFDRLFPEIAGRLDLRVHILISLRDDALAELDRFEGRVPNLFDNYLRLPPMTPPAARRAIERPVAQVNEWRRAAGLPAVEIEDGLVGDVLDQLTDQRRWSPDSGLAAPPADGEAVEPAFLQLVMRRLWDLDAGRRPPVLRRSTLASLGGADAIVRDHLDSAMAALTRSQQATAAAAFGYLVTPSGAKIRYTADDLAHPDYADRPVAEVRDVLETLAAGQARIIRKVPAPSGDPEAQGYEIFHDVLADAVRAWAVRQRREGLERRTARLAGGLVAIVAIAAGLLAYAGKPALLQRLELRTVDARFGLRGAERPDPKIVLVAFDDRTLRAMPPSRTADAGVISRVSAGAPAAIVVDIEYVSAGKPGTPALVSVLKRAHRVVLATFRINEDGNTVLFNMGPQRTFYSATTGYSGFPKGPDGALRHVRDQATLQLTPGQAGLPRVAKTTQPTATKPVGLPTLAVAAAQIAGEPVDTAAFPKGSGAWIDFAGGPGTYRAISYLDVLSGAVSPQTFRGRIVVIGRTDRAALDRFRTPGGVMPGPEIHANAIATVRAGLPLRDAGWPAPVALIVILPLLCAALTLRCSLRRALLISAFAGLLVLVGAQLAFDAGRIVSLVYPELALVLSGAGAVVAARIARSARPANSAGSPASTARKDRRPDRVSAASP